MRRTPARVALWTVVLAAACVGPDEPSSDFAGSAACRGCHAPAFAAWEHSAHALAARPASAVPLPAAAFDGVERPLASIRFTPKRLASGPILVAHGSGGDAGHAPAWVLGVRQVVQPLVPARAGRWQAFPAAWDPMRGDWFDVFPEAPEPGAWTHWHGPGATANSQCLECHMTGYEKRFDLEADRYNTRWHEAGVGCEACHGAGAAHVAAREGGEVDAYGRLPAGDALGPGCVFCHSRRVPLVAAYDPAAPTLDQLAPALLDDPDAFHADGQLAGESYEWASFRLSRMAAEGVVCGDCHEPHSGALRVPGNALCLSCHEPRFDTAAHTQHAPGSAGSACVACHMPAHVFMERDERRDHMIAVPDPATAAAVGAPDACTACHAGETQAWAAARVEEWWGRGGAQEWRERVARALHAGRAGDPAASAGLVAVLDDRDLDALRRASAARLLEPWAGEAPVRTSLRRALAADDALVRAGAAMALGTGASEGEHRDVLALELVRAAGDPTRLVRTEAAFALRELVRADADAPADPIGEHATAEWLAAQAVMDELPEPHFNAGVFHAARGDLGAAEGAYRQALARWPHDRAPRYNLALLLAETGRAEDALRELETLRAQAPAWPPVLVSLALLRAEREEWAQVVDLLEACVRVAPLHPRAAYNLGLAYTKVGNVAFADHAFALAAHDPDARADALRERVRLAYHRGDEAALQALLPEALSADPVLRADPRIREALEMVR